MSDDRWLWPPTAEILGTVRPTWFVGENVTHLDGPALETVVFDLETLGYQVAPPLEVPACAFGFNHRRSRLWILGYTDRNGEPVCPVYEEMAWMSKRHDDTEGVGTPDGFSGKLDARRMAALGNALVPQIAQWIAERIKIADPKKR